MPADDTSPFIIDDPTTGGKSPRAQATVIENADGTPSFVLRQLDTAGVYLGDLHGFLIDLQVAQDGALAGMTALKQVLNPHGSGSGTATQSVTAVVGNDTVVSAGSSSNNMNGLAQGGDYDFDLEVGNSGIAQMACETSPSRWMPQPS